MQCRKNLEATISKHCRVPRNTTWEHHNYGTPVNGAQTWPKATQSIFTTAKQTPTLRKPKTDLVTIKPRRETNQGSDIKYTEGHANKLLICETRCTSVKIISKCTLHRQAGNG